MISARARLQGADLDYYALARLADAGYGDPSRLPMTIKVLLEGLLRQAETGRASESSVRALTRWPEPPPPDAELPYLPSRILLQDFTGVPAVVDLAAMRSAMQRAGVDPSRIDPQIPADLVIDHSVQVDAFGNTSSYHDNIGREYERNGERYALLRWAQTAFDGFRVVPPGMGICHQVNLEHLARVVQVRDGVAMPDTLVGTDSHTTMVNGVSVLGWGVGGIEAEAAMLGQPMFLPKPIVLGVRMTGALPAGTTATDLVLTLTQMLRAHGVVGEEAAKLVRNGSVVIAAITSCTNTSNPSVMIASGLLAKKAVEAGLQSKPWVKTSLAPGSRVVTEYLEAAGLTPYLDKLGFSLVGFGCTTCIGNSGPLPEDVAEAVQGNDLAVVAVLSGNRNFEGRIPPQVRASYLASPPLVVAYALAGSIEVDLAHDPLGRDPAGEPVYLRDVWPTPDEIKAVIAEAVRPEMFTEKYSHVFEGDERWQLLPIPKGNLYEWDPGSTYIQEPPFFQNLAPRPAPIADIVGARVLAMLGDSVTTDHISPAGAIPPASPAGRYLRDR